MALVLLHGGESRTVIQWEADFEREVGAFIERRMRENPSPGPSRVADSFADWAVALQRHAARATGGA